MNERQSDMEIATYLHQAESWNEESYRKIKASRTRAWYLTGLLLVLLTMAVFAIAVLVPLHRIETIPVVVNQKTGHVEVKKPLSRQSIKPSVAIKKSYLGQYVIARETFDSADMRQHYNKVALMSTSQAFKRYGQLFHLSGKRNPLVRYSGGTKRVVHVISISMLNENTGQVRFTTTIEQPHASSPPIKKDWIATIQFAYTSRPMALKERIVNPLGFEVGSYRVDQESFINQ